MFFKKNIFYQLNEDFMNGYFKDHGFQYSFCFSFSRPLTLGVRSDFGSNSLTRKNK